MAGSDWAIMRGPSAMTGQGYDVALKRAARGDRSAFNELLAWCEDEMWRLATRYVALDETARDICQDVLLSAWQHLPTFRGDSHAFRAWLMRSLTNRCRDWHEHQSVVRRRTWLTPAGTALTDSQMLLVADVAPGPEDLVEDEDFERLLNEALASLAEPFHTTLLLYCCDYDYTEIAAITGVGVNTVSSRLSRARKQAQTYLRQHAAELTAVSSLGAAAASGREDDP